MPILYKVTQHPKDGHKYIEITGFEGSVSKLIIPSEIEGLPVEAIGNHSFSGRQDIVSISLPETVRTLYGFAFHNCRKLKKISLFDSIDDYYDGVCRQCDSLTDIEITMKRGWYEVVRNFLSDNDRTLRFMLHMPDSTACLTFPEYVYDFNENTMARTIQFSIAGSGMFYRESVDRRSMDYRQYDRLFEKAVIDGNAISGDIALGRILYPVELADGFRSAYEEYVRNNSFDILQRLIDSSQEEKESLNDLKSLLGYKACKADAPLPEPLITGEVIDRAIKYASQKGLAEVCAILMEHGGNTPSSTGIFVL